MTSAAGLAMGGLHPVVAIYSTFLNRAFDQIMMDVALHKLPVTMVLDRAGITGSDGASHNGMWDLSMLGIVPGIRVAAPRDATRLREELGEALDVDDGPTALRFPKGDVGEDISALERRGGVDVLAAPADGLNHDVLLVAIGAFAPMALAVAKRLHNQGIGVTVIDPRWVLPVSDGVRELAVQHKLLVTLEDNGVNGGRGQRCRPRCGARRSTCPAAMSGCRRSSTSTRLEARCWPIWGLPTRTWPGGSPAGSPRWVPGCVRPTRFQNISTKSHHRPGRRRPEPLSTPRSGWGPLVRAARPVPGRCAGTPRQRQSGLENSARCPPIPNTAVAPDQVRPGSRSVPAPVATPPSAPRAPHPAVRRLPVSV